jgi:hypothetical protein
MGETDLELIDRSDDLSTHPRLTYLAVDLQEEKFLAKKGD